MLPFNCSTGTRETTEKDIANIETMVSGWAFIWSTQQSIPCTCMMGGGWIDYMQTAWGCHGDLPSVGVFLTSTALSWSPEGSEAGRGEGGLSQLASLHRSTTQQ